MATQMLMPLLGQTMEEGTIIKWFKKEGDTVTAGEPLLEVMTDKVNMEVEVPESGVLRKILVEADDVVPVKDPICIIGTATESIDDLTASSTPAQAEATPDPVVRTVQASAASAAPAPAQSAGARVFASPAARRVAREHSLDVAVLAGRGTGPGGRIVEKDVEDYLAAVPRTTPLAARMAQDLGVSVSGVAGSGVGGRVTSEDVARAMAAQSAASSAAIGQVIPYAGMRKAIGQNVAVSRQTAPHVTLVSEVDMTECVRLRNQVVGDIESNYGVRISYTDIIAKAAARAILDKPIVNSSFDGENITIHDRVNIGIATALPDGLVVPVVKDVHAKTLPHISREIKELVGRARAGQAGGDDFRGGTFSITNLGAYGIDSFDPIITPGQSAILGVCRIVEKPVVVGGEIVVRSMMNLCLSFDHRVMDGAPAAEYLARLRTILESPYLIFM